MKKYLIIPVVMASFFSCEKAFIEKDPENNPANNFDVLWETLDRKYAFFGSKNVDWDAVYDKYRPQVEPDMGQVALFDLMSEMLYELEDGHVNLVSAFDISRYWEWYLNSPPNFNYDLLERNYLGTSYRITGPFRSTLIDSVGYIYYGSFSSSFDTTQLDLLINTFNDYKGLIFDVRDNGGGELFNAFTIASRFADKEIEAYYEQFKEGPAHDDFSELVPRRIAPEGKGQFTKPVVLLVNRSSYSAANDFTAIMRNFPHVTVMGDTTGGGGGLPADYDLPNGWRFRFSSSRSFTPDGLDIEPGIPPDKVVYMQQTDILKGEDSILEEALELLK